MRAFTLTKDSYAGDLSGHGAKINGGRWNPPGMPVVYTSMYRSLALLELLVHLHALKALHHNFVFTTISVENDTELIEIPQSIVDQSTVKINDYGALWNITTECFAKRNLLGMKVPSVILPKEHNLILNPLHPAFAKKVSIKKIEPYELDPRLMN